MHHDYETMRVLVETTFVGFLALGFLRPKRISQADTDVPLLSLVVARQAASRDPALRGKTFSSAPDHGRMKGHRPQSFHAVCYA
jgi:hypothetical protein